MSDQVPYQPVQGLPQFPSANELRRSWGLPVDPAERMVIDDQGVALTIDETLRCRDQALYSAALITEATPFPEDDAEKIVVMAKRFERYMRCGE